MKTLIVDDDEANHELMQQCLSKIEIVTLHAKSGQEALELFEEHADITSLIVDIEMPKMNGFEFAKAFYEKFEIYDLPLLFISAYRVDEVDFIEGYKLGAFDYLTRPFHCKVLQSKIKLYSQLYSTKKKLQEHNDELEHIRSRLVSKLHDASTRNFHLLDSSLACEERCKALEEKNKDLEKLIGIYLEEMNLLIQNN